MTTIRQATASDAGTVAGLVHKLASELGGQEREPPPLAGLREAAEQVIGRDSGVWAFLAEDVNGNVTGVLTLNESTAIYAGGRFGTISELYIEPSARSVGTGRRLLDAAVAFGRTRQWGRLEVGAPRIPRWARTVAFYQSNNFVLVGPRLKLLID